MYKGYLEEFRDFFSNPSNIEYAGRNLVDYYENTTENWVGFRSRQLKQVCPSVHAEVQFSIKKLIPNIKWTSIDCYFHYMLERHSYSRRWMHFDANCSYAGVIYLSPNPDPMKGTYIHQLDSAKYTVLSTSLKYNEYNKFIFYSGTDVLHSAAGGFGDSLQNARLTIPVFIR